MKKTKKRIIILGLFLFSFVFATGVLIWHNNSKKTSDKEDYLQKIQNEKLQELKQAEGYFSEDSIVLNDTNKDQAEMIAEQIGGRLRITDDGSYAVIYLEGNTTIDQVYASEEYRAYLEEMSLVIM